MVRLGEVNESTGSYQIADILHPKTVHRFVSSSPFPKSLLYSWNNLQDDLDCLKSLPSSTKDKKHSPQCCHYQLLKIRIQAGIPSKELWITLSCLQEKLPACPAMRIFPRDPSYLSGSTILHTLVHTLRTRYVPPIFVPGILCLIRF